MQHRNWRPISAGLILWAEDDKAGVEQKGFDPMSIRTQIAERFAHFATGLQARAQLRRELQDTSDRGLAEMRLSRGDIDDLVSGTYGRAAWAAVPSPNRAFRAAGAANARS